MKRSPNAQTFPYKAQRGFTLVELITIVVILSIVSIVVAPRILDSTGFAEYALQKRALSALRNMQLKSMYDTRSNICYIFTFDTGVSPKFGPSSASYLSGQEAASCGVTLDPSSPEFLRTQNDEMADEGISLEVSDSGNPITYIQFNSTGRALTSQGTCSQGCNISFVGENTASICINQQGYIYGC